MTDMSVVQTSISAGLLVVVIVIIRAIALNSLPKTMFLVLWGIVILRLLVPFSIPLNLNVYDAVREITKVFSSNSAVPAVIENVLSMGESAGRSTEGTEIPLQISEATREKIVYVSPVLIIWLAGIFAVLTCFAVIYFRNNRALRYALPIRDDDFFNKWLAENKLARRISILQSDSIATPVAVGLFSPRIILPKCMEMSDERLLSYVLAHEYFHIQRFDAFWKLLLVAALCVHWFNPLVWVMFVLAGRDLELTCDEKVVRRFGTQTKTDYVYSIINLSEQRSKFTPLYSGFSKNAAEERIESIMKFKRKSLVSTLLAYVLVFVLAISVFSMPVSANAANANGEAANTTAANDAQGLSMNNFISDERAKAIALEQTGGGQVTLCRLSYNQDAAEYAVGVQSEGANYLFAVNAYTGEVKSFTRESQLETSFAPSAPDSIPEAPAMPISIYSMPETPYDMPPETPTRARARARAVAPPPAFNNRANFTHDSDRARQIALARVGGGAVARTESKSRYHKVIIVSDGRKYDVKINFDGSVRKLKMKEVTTVGAKAFAHNTAGTIDAARAKSIALERAGGGIVTACKLDFKSRQGFLVYKVKVANGRMEHKIELFAANGSIYKHDSKYKS